MRIDRQTVPPVSSLAGGRLLERHEVPRKEPLSVGNAIGASTERARSQLAYGTPGQSAQRTALAGLIGNVLEWFDFAVYGYFATDIGRQFFPQSSATAQQLLAFAVFAVGFAARPIGSVVLGIVGDRIGRCALLTLSIALMGGATLAIGLLPTYAMIGAAAPLLLVTLRLVQGFSVGGEFTGSMVYTTELASAHSRGFISSSAAMGASIGFILGSGCAWLVNALLGSGGDVAWKWRIPFIASVLLCVFGWFLRRGLHETPEGLAAAASVRHSSHRCSPTGFRCSAPSALSR